MSFSSPSSPKYIRMEEVPAKPTVARKPCVRTEYEFFPFQMRQIYRRIELYDGNSKVPVVLYRRCLRRLLDMLDPAMTFDLEAFGSSDGGWNMGWSDVRRAIDDGQSPKVKLSFPQVVFLTMEDFSQSHLGLVWYCIMNTAIIINITIIFVQSLETFSDENEQETFKWLLGWCVNLFMFDFFCKAFCVVHCPIALIDEAWMLDHLLPSGNQANLASKSLHTSKYQRFMYWLSSPANVIDLLSILPNLLAVMITEMHIPLSSLRMLRLLRVIRVLRAFKAVGKWVTTLQVMGEAFASSMGTISVLILYIVLFSMVGGAVLYQQEHENDTSGRFIDVPTAFIFVSERFVGKAFSDSSSIIGGLLLAALGMCRGIIFLLPIERLKKATKDSEDRFAEITALRNQVEQEDMMKVQKGREWASDFRCPVVRCAVYDDSSPQGQEVASIGMLHVPICESETTEATVMVPLHGGCLQTMFGGRPEIEFNTIWTPGSNHSERLPKGALTLDVVRGLNFPKGTGIKWRVHLIIPEELYGEKASTDWITSVAVGQASGNPEWKDQSREFSINWTVKEESPSGAEETHSFVMAARMSLRENHEYQEKVIELLQEQKQHILALEEEIKAMKKMQSETQLTQKEIQATQKEMQQAAAHTTTKRR